MPDILSPTGIEKPIGGELHSRAQYNRNMDRVNAVQIEVDAEENERKKLRHAEFTGPAISYPLSTAQWGVGVLSPDTGSTPNVTHNNSFVVYESSDTLKIIEQGIYLFTWLLSSTSLPPNGEIGIKNATRNAFITTDDLSQAVAWGVPLVAPAFVSANDLITFITFNRSGAFSATSRIKVTKLQG